nr:DMT family transporter [Pseudoclavibacter sp. Marseille-Q3772]
MHYLGIPIALLGAILMSVSAYLQHRGVNQVGDKREDASTSANLGGKELLGLVKNFSWLSGTVCIGLAIALQLVALMFSPLVVVQPLGVVSLVVTALITAWQTEVRMSRGKIVAISLCVIGVAAFVTVAAFAADQGPVGDGETSTVLIVLAAVLVATLVAYLVLRKTQWRVLMFTIIGGVLYGFVATLARIVLARFQHDEIGPLLYACAAGLLIALLIGGYAVQSAYAAGSTDIVIAGLTVIDPIVAVAIGVLILNETMGAGVLEYTLFALFGAISIAGVVVLQLQTPEEEVEAARKHATRT